jgi:hypothetical protein
MAVKDELIEIFSFVQLTSFRISDLEKELKKGATKNIK